MLCFIIVGFINKIAGDPKTTIYVRILLCKTSQNTHEDREPASNNLVKN